MRKSKYRVYKYGTGQDVPEGAKYLTTITNGDMPGNMGMKFVWHYFMVEVWESEQSKQDHEEPNEMLVYNADPRRRGQHE